MAERRLLVPLLLIVLTLPLAWGLPQGARIGVVRIGKGYVLTVEAGGSFNVSVAVRDALGTPILSKNASCIANCSLPLGPLSPGVYYVDVIVNAREGAWSEVERVVVSPGKGDFSTLLADLSRLAATVKGSPYMYSDLTPLVGEAETYFRLALKAHLEGRGDDAAYYYMRSRRLVDYLQQALARRGEGPMYSAFSHLEEYLNLNFPVVLDFWVKLFMSTFILPLLLLALAPLYISSVEDWIRAVIEGLDVKDEAAYTAAEESRRRALEILQGASGLVKVKPKTLIMTLISALIAAIGLVTNNTAVIIASMLIAPFMSVVLGAAIGLSMPHREVVVDGEKRRGEELFSEGLRNIVVLTLASLALVWVTVKIASFFVPIVPGSEIMARSRPNFSDLAIAIGAGLACAVSYVGVLEFSGLIGAAIAIALIPPLATVGIGLAIGRPDITLGSFSLFYINTISIILASILVIKLYIVYPAVVYFFSNLQARAENALEFIVESIQFWIDVTFGFHEGFTEENIKYNFLRLIRLLAKFIFFPVLVVAGYAVLMSSPLPLLLSKAAIGLLSLASRATLFTSYRLDLVLSLAFLAAMANYTARILRGCKDCRGKFLAVTALFWITSSLATRIIYFPRSNLVFFTILVVYAVVVYKWEHVRKRWSHYVVIGFTVFTILVISLQSIEVYQVSMVAQKLSSESRVVADTVAIFFGTSPDNVTTTVVQGRNPHLLVKISMSVRSIDDVKKLAGALDILEGALRRYGFSGNQVEVTFTLKP